jgi:hypothetical protein
MAAVKQTMAGAEKADTQSVHGRLAGLGAGVAGGLRTALAINSSRSAKLRLPPLRPCPLPDSLKSFGSHPAIALLHLRGT